MNFLLDLHRKGVRNRNFSAFNFFIIVLGNLVFSVPRVSVYICCQNFGSCKTSKPFYSSSDIDLLAGNLMS